MRKTLFALTTAALLTSTSALAQNTTLPEGLWQFSIGYYDVLDDEEAIDLRVEYRPNSIIFVDNLKPFVGAEVTSDTSIWVGGGLLYDYNFANNWYATPSIGAGLYAQGSSDLDLGHVIEFRSQLEVSYQFEDETRVGLSFSHLSNAGLDDHNPGTEVLSLSYSLPF